MEAITTHELGADENARAQTSETSRLRPGNHAPLRHTKAERQAEGRFSSLFKGPYVIVNVKSAGSLPTFAVSLRDIWQQLTGAASNF